MQLLLVLPCWEGVVLTRSAKQVETVAVIDCGASEVRAYIADLGGNPNRKILDNLHFQVGADTDLSRTTP